MSETNVKPYSPALLAARWSCSISHVYNLLNTGSLTGFRLGTLWRIPALSVEEYERRPPSPSASQSASDQPEARTAPPSLPTGPTAAATAARLARLTE